MVPCPDIFCRQALANSENVGSKCGDSPGISGGVYVSSSARVTNENYQHRGFLFLFSFRVFVLDFSSGTKQGRNATIFGSTDSSRPSLAVQGEARTREKRGLNERDNIQKKWRPGSLFMNQTKISLKTACLAPPRRSLNNIAWRMLSFWDNVLCSLRPVPSTFAFPQVVLCFRPSLHLQLRTAVKLSQS